MCGIDVYKFRDVLPEDDAPAAVDSGEQPGAGKGPLSLGAKHVRVALGAVVFLAAVAWFAWHRPAVPAPATSQGPVIPIEVAPRPAPGNPSAVSITHFGATPTDAGVVKVTFRLNNSGGASSDYPGLAVHWHGAPGADQLIGRDSYAHPPLPFTATDVTLELARPQGATGIDVKITY